MKSGIWGFILLYLFLEEIKQRLMTKNLSLLALVSTILMLLAAIAIVLIYGFNFTEQMTSYPVPIYLEPSGYAFSIWLPIYLGFIGLGIFQMNPPEEKKERFQKARPFILLNAGANIGWFFGLITQQGWLTLVCMLLLLYTLTKLAICLELGGAGALGRERWLVKLPLALYFGWITVATPISITTFLIEALGWTGRELWTPEIWSVLVLLVAFLIIVALFIGRWVNAVYVLVGLWGFFAIYQENLGLSSQVAYSALVLSVLFLVVLIWSRLRNKEGFVFL